MSATPAIVYCSTSGYGQDGPRSGLGRSRPRLPGRQRLPGDERARDRRCSAATGCDGRRRRGGGHARRLSIMAALLARRSTSGNGRIPRRGRRRRRALADVARGGRAPCHGILAAAGARRPERSVRLLRQLPEAADGRFVAVGAIEPKFFANLCGALGCAKWSEHQYDDDSQDEIRADLAAAFACRDRDSWVDELAGADTCVAPVLEPAEVAGDAQYRSRKRVRGSGAPDERDGSCRWVRCAMQACRPQA
jgi:alpha-methylacyl-CoA racemase